MIHIASLRCIAEQLHPAIEEGHLGVQAGRAPLRIYNNLYSMFYNLNIHQSQNLKWNRKYFAEDVCGQIPPGTQSTFRASEIKKDRNRSTFQRH